MRKCMKARDLERLLYLEKKLYNSEELSREETKEFERLFNSRIQQLIKEYYSSL